MTNRTVGVGNRLGHGETKNRCLGTPTTTGSPSVTSSTSSTQTDTDESSYPTPCPEGRLRVHSTVPGRHRDISRGRSSMSSSSFVFVLGATRSFSHHGRRVGPSPRLYPRRTSDSSNCPVQLSVGDASRRGGPSTYYCLEVFRRTSGLSDTHRSILS